MKTNDQVIRCLFLLCHFVKLSMLLPLIKTRSTPNGHSHYNPEENIGAKMFLVEGDILIDRESYYAMLEQDNKDLDFEADPTDAVSRRSNKRQKRSVDAVYHLMWLNRTVPYEFDVNLGPQARKLVFSAMTTIEKSSCVRFKRRQHEKDYVHILVPNTTYSNQGDCYSKVGRNGGRQDVGLSSICPFGTVVHELLHALGLWHEHNRKDRNEFISVLWDNIKEGKHNNFCKSGGQNQEVVLSLPYDYGSIMHYANNTFSKNDQKQTLKAIKTLPPNVEMGQRARPSQLDIAKLNALYMCDIKDCTNPGALENGNVHGLKVTVGSKVKYSCRSGYVLIGASERTCLTIRQWSGDQPSCLPNTDSDPVHYCNFDHPRHPLCGWTQSTDDILDWTLNSGATTTPGTGPYWDNTYNTASGVYLYVEASLNGYQQRSKGAMARLKSPTFDASAHSNICLVFFTYMYGTYMGNLAIYKQEEGSSDAEKELLMFIEGDQGNEWKQRYIVVGKMTRPYHIYFEGSIGGYSSDIAIDDVTVGSCKNFKPLTASALLQHSLACSFDDGHICHFLQDRHDNADWNITGGGTRTYNTGPDCDPIHCATGRYLYLEASYPRRQGDEAKLKTTVLGGLGPTCVSFFYHMYGDGIGSLAIKMISATTGIEQRLWSKTGNQGQRWFSKYLEYDAQDAYEISIEGVVGTYKGDVAIDNIAITNGGCTGLMKFNCSFEHDMCGWQNVPTPGDTYEWTRHIGETNTPYTGPTSERTSPDGYFLYVESSRSDNTDSARLISSAIQQTLRGYCLSYWYHMYGSMTGNLTVYAQSEIGVEEVVWRASGDHGNRWLFQKMALTSFPAQTIHVIFEVKLDGYRGDTAIDDVTIQHGSCIT